MESAGAAIGAFRRPLKARNKKARQVIPDTPSGRHKEASTLAAPPDPRELHDRHQINHGIHLYRAVPDGHVRGVLGRTRHPGRGQGAMALAVDQHNGRGQSHDAFMLSRQSK